jgi:hypothetical protein
MELILANRRRRPNRLLRETRKRGLLVYLALWAIVFPVQTVVVYSMDGSDGEILYWIFNALILCVGLGLNRLGSVLGERRRASRAVAEAA